MNKKVTLLELVATKTIYAILIVVYYWMWARRNWHDYYVTLQYAVVLFTIVFLHIQGRRIRKYQKEIVDEMAQHNLTRANSICLKIMVVLLAIIAFLGATEIFTNIMMGYAIVSTFVIIAITRTIIFYIMDTRGI